MPIINTGLITKGLRSEFFSRFNATTTRHQDLCTRIQSNTNTETYRWLGSVPQMREWGSGRIARGIASESYSVENLKYEATLEVDRDEIADDQTGQLRVRIAELADRAATHKDFMVASILESGATAGFHSYDGVPFFNDKHKGGASDAQCNQLSFGAADPNNPTTDEFKAALRGGIDALMGFRDERNEPMATTATGLVAIVPTGMYLTALEAIGATVIAGTSNVYHSVARVIPFAWLNEKHNWYLLKTDTAVRPLIFQDREPIEFTALAEDSDEGFRREKLLYGVRARYRITYGYWQYAVRLQYGK